jgi:hypothetical protein
MSSNLALFICIPWICFSAAALTNSTMLGSEHAQTGETQPPGDLREGLLDLLKDPKPPQENKTPERPKIDGEDVGQAPANPLAEVELGMNTLAGWLRNSSEPAKTKELQRDVVLRLDELIDQLEKRSQSGQKSTSNSSSSTTNSTPASNQPQQSTQPMPSDTTRQQSANKPGETPKPEDKSPSTTANDAGEPGQPGDGSGQPTPGQPGLGPKGKANVTVDLNDPRALQRSAWGSLPERTREQMQSRMVERFLPGYRDEIEAYYRALVK